MNVLFWQRFTLKEFVLSSLLIISLLALFLDDELNGKLYRAIGYNQIDEKRFCKILDSYIVGFEYCWPAITSATLKSPSKNQPIFVFLIV